MSRIDVLGVSFDDLTMDEAVEIALGFMQERRACYACTPNPEIVMAAKGDAALRAALSGAELILCPSAFPIRDKDMWDTYFGSRSLENCCFVAGINRVGTEDDCYMFGNNKIYNYRGHLLAEAPVDDEFLLVQTVDLDDVAYHRATDVPYLQDRRVETYQKLTEMY